MAERLRQPWLGVGVPLVVALIHIAVVAPRYHVGSFDDDAAYIVMSRGILHGVGLGGYLAHHVPLLEAYPPGYPYLLAPMMWLFGDGSYLAERLFSALCVGAIFPLTWQWMGRKRVPDLLRVGVLAMLAVNPLIATYGSMVMAEGPFLLVLVALLLAAERWDASQRWWCPSAVATIGLAVGAVWLKEAALAFLPGLVVWLTWRRRWAPALLAGTVGIALLAPIAIGRWDSGVPLAGSRYTSELGGYYSGGWLHRIALVPVGLAKWCFDAMPSAIVPTGSPLNATLGLFVVFRGLACATTVVLVVVGLVTWIRRRDADLAVFLMLAYVGEVCLYKYVNQRRAFLVLPILVTWWVTGLAESFRWLVARASNLQVRRRWRRGLALCSALVVVGPLTVQFPVDYLYDLGQNSPAPATSPYMALLRRLGSPSQVVETTYLWSTTLLSGHATANRAAVNSATSCDPATVAQDLKADRAVYVLTGAIDIPGQVDSPCLQRVASSASWAVPLLQTPADDASVYEILGTGTAQPGVRALLSVRSRDLAPAPKVAASPSSAGPTTSVWRWPLPSGATVGQVSVNGVAAVAGATGQVVLRLLEGHRWITVASSSGAVGTGQRASFLLASLPPGTQASALQLRVVARGPVRVDNLAVLGAGGPAPA